MNADIYGKVGRGGAGNYYSQQNVEATAKRTAEDLEAQSQTPSTTIPPTATSPTAQLQGYAHSGRGGAGNYYSPQDLHQTGVFAGSAASDATAPPSKTDSVVKEPGHCGRGGAGNYRGGVTEVLEGKVMEAGFTEAAVRDVEMGLREPEKAHLGSEKMLVD